MLGPFQSSSQSKCIRASTALEVLSSEKEGSSVHVPTKVEEFEKPWFDATRGCMVRSIPGKAGVVEEADMTLVFWLPSFLVKRNWKLKCQIL